MFIDNKKNNKSGGFVLLSFLLYLSLFTLLNILCLHWALVSFTTYTTHAQWDRVVVNVYLAHDLFIRDIYMAPFDAKEWKKISSSEIVWHHNNQDIGWCYKDKKLTRTQGQYNKKSATWHKKTISMVANNIDSLAFNIKKERILNQLVIKNISIKCYLTNQKQTHTLMHIVQLKNQIML